MNWKLSKTGKAFYLKVGLYHIYAIATLMNLFSCTGYKVKEIPPGDVLEKELRAPVGLFQDDNSKDPKENEEGKKTGKKK